MQVDQNIPISKNFKNYVEKLWDSTMDDYNTGKINKTVYNRIMYMGLKFLELFEYLDTDEMFRPTMMAIIDEIRVKRSIAKNELSKKEVDTIIALHKRKYDQGP